MKIYSSGMLLVKNIANHRERERETEREKEREKMFRCTVSEKSL